EQAQHTPIGRALHYIYEGQPLDVDASLVTTPKPSAEGAASRIEKTALEDPVVQALGRAGLLREDLGEGKLAIECPFDAEHSGLSTPSSTVYMIPHTGGYSHGRFDCKHAHCATRSNNDFIRKIGLDPEAVRASYASAGAVAP